jgi:hypothetical protein
MSKLIKEQDMYVILYSEKLKLRGNLGDLGVYEKIIIKTDLKNGI